MPQLILKSLVFTGRAINLVYYHCSSFSERLGWPNSWSRELAEYFKTTPQKIVKLYLTKRPQAAQLWGEKPRRTEVQIQSFFQETDYFVFRQNYFHRHKIYLDVALPLWLKRQGSLCEYGGGIGPFTAWLIKFFPRWHYTIIDLDCPVLKFSRWRFRQQPNVDLGIVTASKLPLKNQYDVILCKQVLEHVPNPFRVVKHLVSHLKPNGWLYLDFINDPGEENLEAAVQQRNQVLAYLKKQLISIFTIDQNNQAEGYGLYIKPRGCL